MCQPVTGAWRKRHLGGRDRTEQDEVGAFKARARRAISGRHSRRSAPTPWLPQCVAMPWADLYVTLRAPPIEGRTVVST